MKNVTRKPNSSRMRSLSPFAGDRAHARGHFLNHHESDGDRDHRPEQQMTELRPSGRIRPDAARIVVDIRGDEPWPHDGKEQQDSGLPAFPELHEHTSHTYPKLSCRAVQNKCR